MSQTNKLENRDWALLKTFYQFVKPHKLWVLAAISAIPFTTAATILIPYLIVRIIDDYIVPGDIEGLHQKVIALGFAVVVGYIADGIYVFSLQKAGHLSIAEMRRSLFAHVLRLPRAFYDRTPIGTVLSRLTSDMEAMGDSLAVGALSILTDSIKTIALFGLLFYLSWQLTLIILLILPIVFLLASFLRKKLRHYYNTARESLASATAYLQECLNGMKTIQLYVAERHVLQKFKQKNSRFLRAQTQSNLYDAALFSVIEGLTSVTLAVIIWYGTGQVLASVVTIGVLIGFINTLSKIFIPIREFAQQIASIQRALSALEHIYSLLGEPSESEDQDDSVSTPLISGFQELVFDHVTFRYKSTDEPVLKDISFRLEKGKKIALVGSTGAGKSTILKVLTRAYQEYEGSIKINGIELSSIPKNALIDLITLMQQEGYLFNESLAFNITLDRPNVTEKRLNDAVRYVYADRFIEELPGKMNYMVIDNGSNLSAGQAQLISFARAIAGNSELLLLDEATSSVDSLTEELIQKAIENIFRAKTVISVAHRLSTIQNSDEILVMQNGMIVERGDHVTLKRGGGYYQQLIESMENDSTEP